MRSKQQPRPSYRWLDKDEQDCAEPPEQQQEDEKTQPNETSAHNRAPQTETVSDPGKTNVFNSSQSLSETKYASETGGDNDESHLKQSVKLLQQFPISKLKTNTIDDDTNVNNDNVKCINLDDDDDDDDDVKAININDDSDVKSPMSVNKIKTSNSIQQLTSSSQHSNHSSIGTLKIENLKMLASRASAPAIKSSSPTQPPLPPPTSNASSTTVIKDENCQADKSPLLSESFKQTKSAPKHGGENEICDNLLPSMSFGRTTAMTTASTTTLTVQMRPPSSTESSASPPLPPRSIISLSSNNSISGMSQCIKNIEGDANNSKQTESKRKSKGSTAGGDSDTKISKNSEDIVLTYNDQDQYGKSQPQKSSISGLEACIKQLKNESLHRSKQNLEPYRHKHFSPNTSALSVNIRPSSSSASPSPTTTATLHSIPARTTRSSSRLAAVAAAASVGLKNPDTLSAAEKDRLEAENNFQFFSSIRAAVASTSSTTGTAATTTTSFCRPSSENTKFQDFSSFESDLKALHDMQIEKRNRHIEREFQRLVSESELASPRCQSRESSGSGGRCPSDDSNCSGNGSTSAGLTPQSPVGISLPATLPPGAAAALLPPQSAAMAAYLNVAAAAAQQNRLLLGNPLAAAAAGLVQAAQSPPNLPLASPLHPDDASILDFSTKRMRKDSDTDSKSDSDAVNLSKSSDNGEIGGHEYAPLDLSVGTKKRTSEPLESPTLHRKMLRHTATTPTPGQMPTQWVTPINPYLAAVAAASLSPKNHLDWNGKSKIPNVAPNDAAKALEKMSEMTRLGGPPDNDVPMRLSNSQNNSNSSNSTNTGNTGRHSAWQSHWLNKGADAAKDVFKCVWCKQSFPTLASLTTHMKETQHCGVNVPPSGNLPTQQSNSGGSNQQQQHHHQQSQNPSSNSSNSSKSDLNLLIKETMPLPRKLVRGQDVWLGKGAEQTRQILKCMWCGQSFRSLAEMTSHMQQTQHYTNIISQEQIISWKSAEDGKGTGGGAGGNNGGQPPNANANTNSTVSAVLTCKVCDQAFSSLKDLSNHMVKNAHYKEHIMRSITESGGRRRQTREKRKKSLPVRKLLELERAQHDFKNGDIKVIRPDIGTSTRITCEKCGDKIETALFVEHIRLCVGGQIANNTPRNNMMNKSLSGNNIIPPDSMSPLTPTSSRDGRKSIGGCDDSATSPVSSNRHISPHAPDLASPISSKDGTVGGGGGGSIGGNSSSGEKSSPSVLNAIEQLIEKSFDTRSRHSAPGFSSNSHASAPLGSSILKRLGIDESVDYTKPLIDPQTMSLLRSYQNSQYPKRERSGSESSSVSDRGSSRLESLTPERKPEMMHSNNTSPRESPDKGTNYSHSEHEDEHNKDSTSVKVKTEPLDGDNDEEMPNHNNNNNNNNDNKNEKNNGHDMNKEIKKEINADENERDHNSGTDENNELDLSSPTKYCKANTPSTSAAPSPNQPLSHSFSLNASGSGGAGTGHNSMTPAASPCSDRSTTPRSTTNSINSDGKKLSGSGSLNALSSMFDNLTGSSIGGSNDPNNSGVGSGKKGSSHPLAALQKLCDKTETTTNSRSASSGALSASMPSMGGSSPGNILAFSWACNDAVVTQDSIIKCTLCDTPFCSKGAYRHHLSKVHFVKDEIADPMTLKSSTSSAGSGGSSEHNRSASVSSNKSLPHSRSQSPKIPMGLNANNNNNFNPMSSASAKSPSPSTSSSVMGAPNNQQQQQQSPAPSQSPFDESPHSKFLKYTELAKQLSSKYV